MQARSTNRTGDEGKYRDLVAGRFALNQVVRIERTDDSHTISNKWFDFSYGTISQLIQLGIVDALKSLVNGIKQSEGDHAANIQLNEFINEVDRMEQKRDLPTNQAIQLRKSAQAPQKSQVLV